MKVLIISANQAAHPVPVMPLGACLVAEAAERAGHRVRLLDLMFVRDAVASVEAMIMDFRPDAVGLSIRNIDNNDMRDTVYYLSDLRLLVNTIRKLTGAPIILGGAALGVMPEEILRLANLSCAVLGDGEAVFPQLLERIGDQESMGDLAGVVYREAGAFHANPCPGSVGTDEGDACDFGRWIDVSAYRSQLATAPVQTKIGCQFQCVYCTYRKIEGSAYRLFDPARIGRTIRRLSQAGLCDIEFVDSVFNAPVEHALAICEELARAPHGARLHSLELNPRFFDGRLVSAMEQAGFTSMGLTVESASDRVLQGLGKAFTAEHVHSAAEVVRRRRLPCLWIFLLGGPGETEETVQETIRFAETAVGRRDSVFFNIGVRIYPGTELESIARRQGVLSVPPAEMLRPVFYVSPEVEAGWMAREVGKAMARNMNFISIDSINLPFLPKLHRMGYRMGLRPPLWRHTRIVRRGLRLMGMEV